MKRILPILLVGAIPRAAHACAACGAAVDRSNGAFIVITILLSLLPVAMIGAGLWWVARHASGSLAEEFADREVGAAAGEAAGEGGRIR